MSVILVVPAGGRSHVVAAAMAAAAGSRGARINVGSISSVDVDIDRLVQTVGDQLIGVDISILYLDEAAGAMALVARVAEKFAAQELDLLVHVAVGLDSDRAVQAVDDLRGNGVEPDGLVLESAPREPERRDVARDFLGAATGIPVVGALPPEAAQLTGEELTRGAVTWFDEDDTFDD